MVLLSVDGHSFTAPISMDEEHTKCAIELSSVHLGPGEGSGENFDASGDVRTACLFCNLDSSTPKDTNTFGCQDKGIEDTKGILISESEANNIGYVDIDRSMEDTGAGMSKDHDKFKSFLDLTAHIEGDDSQDAGFPSMEKEESGHSPETTSSNDIILEETGAKDDHKSRHCVSMPRPTSDLPFSANIFALIANPPVGKYEDSENKVLDIESTVHEDSGGLSVHSLSNDLEEKDVQVGSCPKWSSIEEECSKPNISESESSISRLGFEISLCGHLLCAGVGRNSAEEDFEAHRISEDGFKASGPAIIKNGNLIFIYEYFSWDKIGHIIVGMAMFGSNISMEPKDSILVENDEIERAKEEPHGISPSISSRRGRLWPVPFRRVKSLQHSNSNSSNEEVFVDSESCLRNPRVEQTPSSYNNQSPRKQLLRTNIPTTEQIASLNLKDQNTIAFGFSTRDLGKQQVDAQIYL